MIDNTGSFPAIWLGDLEWQIETTVHGIPDKSTTVTKTLGEFPSRISMDSNELISGVPGESGTFEFFLEATDSRGLTATCAYRIWVFSL